MQFARVFAGIDLAILTKGDNLTLGLENADRGAKMIQTTMVIGVHYDTFGFIETAKQKAMDLFKQPELDLKLPEMGETIEI